MFMNSKYIFSESFDTFKVFESLTVEKVNKSVEGMPQTIWQILNHLAIWQAHQITLLKGGKSGNAGFSEQASWIEDKYVQHQEKLDEQIETLTTQIEWIKHFINSLNTHEHRPENELKIIQDMSTHLSFHLGELVLIMRIDGDYPLPHQMKAFLS
jgi:uncharacterized damage-inducible protein DinB